MKPRTEQVKDAPGRTGLRGERSSGRRSPRLTGLSRALVGAIVLLALAAGAAAWLRPENPFQRDAGWFAAAAVFVSSYTALAIGRVPGLALDRAGVALVGAALMVACGALPLDEAYKAIDLDTLTLLLGMMIVVAHLRFSGFFALAGGWIIRRARTPMMLLLAITVIAGTFSAFLVNDAICLALTPLVLDLTRSLKRNPAPYLLAVAMGSNIGSTATITGNPQNMMIGSVSRIAYTDFASTLAPVALVGLLLTVVLIALFHRREFGGGTRFVAEPQPTRTHRGLMLRALAGAATLAALLFAGQPPAKVAIVIGALLLVTRRAKTERVYTEIDWPLLLMFAGLFIIVAGAERALLSNDLVAAAARRHLDSVPALAAAAAGLSNLVSNVPAVLLLKPFIQALPDPHTAWLTVAMASTLAGNFTVIGSIANLIVVQRARAGGVDIGFWDYFKLGAPLTILTVLFGTLWLSW
ncbi:MAG: anion transporter [Alphaproteobacteria bacterium]|nr:anion transporter [Alphaproteobacteria bacterium]